MGKVVDTASRLFRRCRGVITLMGLEDSRKVWFYKSVVRPALSYGCPVWIFITPSLMDRVRKVEYHILRALFGQYRRRNGRYVSYRSRLVRAKIPGIDYHMIRLSLMHLTRLRELGLGRVDQESPNWVRELRWIRSRLFTVETTMFMDALGLLLDSEGGVLFHSLDRRSNEGHFDLTGALDPNGYRRAIRLPTIHDKRSVEGLERRWRSWAVP